MRGPTRGVRATRPNQLSAASASSHSVEESHEQAGVLAATDEGGEAAP
jgi:hypothetical protein